MKILTVVDNLGKGGTQRVAQVFAEAYNTLGHDSRILALYGLGPRYDEVKELLTIYHELNETNLEKIATWRPDVLHIHSHGPELADIETLIAIKQPQCRVIETNVFSQPSKWASHVDISYQLSKWALWIFNLRGGKKYTSAIVPNPVKCDTFKPAKKNEIREFRNTHNIPDDAFLLGRIGQSYPGKWSPLLVEVFDELSKEIPNLYLLMVNAPESILQQAEKSNYRNKIIIVPKILGDQKLAIAYSAMNVMVHIAEQGESFGLVLPEAILCGTPVITMSTPWGDNSQCEVVGHKEGGFVVHTKKGVKKAIHEIIKRSRSKNLKFHDKIVEEKYAHVRVAEKALEGIQKIDEHPDLKMNAIHKILRNSFDRPSLITVFLIRLNVDKLRRLTSYSSGYRDLSMLIPTLLRLVGVRAK